VSGLEECFFVVGDIDPKVVKDFDDFNGTTLFVPADFGFYGLSATGGDDFFKKRGDGRLDLKEAREALIIATLKNFTEGDVLIEHECIVFAWTAQVDTHGDGGGGFFC